MSVQKQLADETQVGDSLELASADNFQVVTIAAKGCTGNAALVTREFSDLTLEDPIEFDFPAGTIVTRIIPSSVPSFLPSSMPTNCPIAAPSSNPSSGNKSKANKKCKKAKGKKKKASKAPKKSKVPKFSKKSKQPKINQFEVLHLSQDYSPEFLMYKTVERNQLHKEELVESLSLP